MCYDIKIPKIPSPNVFKILWLCDTAFFSICNHRDAFEKCGFYNYDIRSFHFKPLEMYMKC